MFSFPARVAASQTRASIDANRIEGVDERRKERGLRRRNFVVRLRGLWANGMQASGGVGGRLPSRRGRSIRISIFMGLSRLRATVPRGT